MAEGGHVEMKEIVSDSKFAMICELNCLHLSRMFWVFQTLRWWWMVDNTYLVADRTKYSRIFTSTWVITNGINKEQKINL